MVAVIRTSNGVLNQSWSNYGCSRQTIETFCGSCPKTANAGAGYMRTLFHSLEGQSSCQKHLDKIRNRTPSLDIGIVCTSLFVVFCILCCLQYFQFFFPPLLRSGPKKDNG